MIQITAEGKSIKYRVQWGGTYCVSHAALHVTLGVSPRSHGRRGGRVEGLAPRHQQAPDGVDNGVGARAEVELVDGHLLTTACLQDGLLGIWRHNHPELPCRAFDQGLQDLAVSQLIKGESLAGHNVVLEDFNQLGLRQGMEARTAGKYSCQSKDGQEDGSPTGAMMLAAQLAQSAHTHRVIVAAGMWSNQNSWQLG